MQKESEHFYNDDLREFEKLNTTTESIYELGDLRVLIILKDGRNLIDYLDIENPEDVIYISEDLSHLKDVDNYYYLGNVVKRRYGDDSSVFNWYGENPLRNVKALVCQGITSEITSLYEVFCQLDNVTTISGLDTWDVSSVSDMRSLFVDCTNLKTVHGLDSWDVGNVLNMNWTFKNCRSLEDISFFKSWDVSNVKSMKGMFIGCSNLKNIEALSDWNGGNVKDMEDVLYNNPIQTEFDGSPGFDTPIKCIYCGGDNFILDGDLICIDCGKVIFKSSDFKCPDCGGSNIVQDGELYCRDCGLLLSSISRS